MARVVLYGLTMVCSIYRVPRATVHLQVFLGVSTATVKAMAPGGSQNPHAEGLGFRLIERREIGGRPGSATAFGNDRQHEFGSPTGLERCCRA